MPTRGKFSRRSVSLPSRVARRVRALANARGTGANRVILELIECGLEVKERECRRYLDGLRQLRAAASPVEQQRLTAELARLTFGE